jgi:hypothetical protein
MRTYRCSRAEKVTSKLSTPACITTGGGNSTVLGAPCSTAAWASTPLPPTPLELIHPSTSSGRVDPHRSHCQASVRNKLANCPIASSPHNDTACFF